MTPFWFLIIVGTGVGIDHVPFATEDACLAAANLVKENTKDGFGADTLKAFCAGNPRATYDPRGGEPEEDGG